MAHSNFILDRRELLGLLGIGALAARGYAAQEQAPQFSALDHFEFYVSNPEKSRDFYVRIFGNTLLSRGAKRYLKLGSTYMAFEAPRGTAPAGQVDHVSAAIKGLDMTKLHAFLQQRGVVYQDYPSGRDTAVLDPDGTRLQLSPEDGWGLLNPATFLPEGIALPEASIFRAVGLDHVLFNVTDVEKSVAHYQKFLGAPSQRDSNGVWFQAGSSRIGIALTLAGQRAGVRHICINAASFDSESATRRLEQLGAKLETPRTRGLAVFRDLDGLLIQVSGERG